MKPWDANFSLLQVLPVLAGLFYAANILTIRKACRNESPLALAFAAAITFVIAATIVIGLLSLFPSVERVACQHAIRRYWLA